MYMFLETSRKRDPSHAQRARAPPSYTAEGGMVSKNIYLSALAKAFINQRNNQVG